MYTNGRLTPGHRERLERMLHKEEEEAGKRRMVRSQSHASITPACYGRQKSVPRVKVAFHLPHGNVNSSRANFRKPRRPASRGEPVPRSAKHSPHHLALARPATTTLSHMSGRMKTPMGSAGKKMMAHSRSEKDISAFDRSALRGNPQDLGVTGGLVLPSTRGGGGGGSRRSGRGSSRTGEMSKSTKDDLLELLSKKLKFSGGTAKLHPRSDTATVLFGCRESPSVSPDATPRPTRLMREREAAKGAGGTNWISIVEHNQRLAERDELRNEKMDKAVRNEFGKYLAAQRQAERDSLQQAVVDREQEKQRLQGVYKRWVEEDAAQEARQHKRRQQLKLSCKQQMDALDQRRRYETEKWRRRDQRAAAALQQSLVDEAAKAEKKKIENKIKMKKMYEENGLKQLRRREEAIREQEETIRLHHEYAAQLEKQERQRAENLAKIQARQDKNLASLLTVTKTWAEQAEEDERRAERESAEVNRRAEERDRAKAERLRREQLLINETVLKQREENRMAREKDEREWREYGDSINRDAEMYAEELKWKKEATRHKSMDTAAIIREQMRLAERRRLAERAEMNDNERLLNRPLLRECEQSARAHDRAHAHRNNVNAAAPDSSSNSAGPLSPITTERMARLVNHRAPFRWRFDNRPRPF